MDKIKVILYFMDKIKVRVKVLWYQPQYHKLTPSAIVRSKGSVKATVFMEMGLIWILIFLVYWLKKESGYFIYLVTGHLYIYTYTYMCVFVYMYI